MTAKYDIWTIRSQTNSFESATALWSWSDGGKLCTGPVFAAQTWLLHLLTQRGSMVFAPEIGTHLVALLKQGRIRNEMDLQAEFNLASRMAIIQIRNEIDPNTSPDRVPRDVKVRRVVLTAGKAIIEAVLTTETGETTDVDVVLDTTPASFIGP